MTIPERLRSLDPDLGSYEVLDDRLLADRCPIVTFTTAGADRVGWLVKADDEGVEYLSYIMHSGGNRAAGLVDRLPFERIQSFRVLSDPRPQELELDPGEESPLGRALREVDECDRDGDGMRVP